MSERYNGPNMHPIEPTFGTLWWLVDALVKRQWKFWKFGQFTARQNNGHPLLVITEQYAGRHALIPCLFGTHARHSKAFVVPGKFHNSPPGYFFDALKPIK